MVSVYTNPLPYQDFSHFCSYHMAGDPMKNPGMSGAENCNLIEWNTGPGVEDPNKKVRKPYTITKSRESWSEQEHDKFLEALQLFDRDWKKIEAFVGSKTVIQIRSHAQKYFLKVQKNGTSEHVPPPRPKRKAAHPYPQKAQKSAMVAGPSQSSTALDARCSMRPNPMSVPGNPVIGAPLSPWTYNVLPPTGCTSPVVKDDFASAGVVMRHNYSCSSNESTHRLWTSDETNRQVKEQQSKAVRVMPDFAQVYRFIGSVFDPTTANHLERLKKMDPIDIETALMMMKNLSINLVSPEFENHRRLLSSYGYGIKTHSQDKMIPSV